METWPPNFPFNTQIASPENLFWVVFSEWVVQPPHPLWAVDWWLHGWPHSQQLRANGTQVNSLRCHICLLGRPHAWDHCWFSWSLFSESHKLARRAFLQKFNFGELEFCYILFFHLDNSSKIRTLALDYRIVFISSFVVIKLSRIIGYLSVYSVPFMST